MRNRQREVTRRKQSNRSLHFTKKSEKNLDAKSIGCANHGVRLPTVVSEGKNGGLQFRDPLAFRKRTGGRMVVDGLLDREQKSRHSMS
jgi:hypothetical protein